MKKIAFLGGSSWQEGDQVYQDAYTTAKLLTQNGFQVVNGGGPGVMRAATLGAKAAGATNVLAVTYHPNKHKKNYEGIDPNNPFDEEVVTLDYFDRTKVMLQNTDLHIVFNGSTGTISEFGMTWASSRIHESNNKPIVLFGEFWNHILDVFREHMLVRPGEENLCKICTKPDEVLAYAIQMLGKAAITRL